MGIRTASGEVEAGTPKWVLWVDDQPDNNALEIAQLRDNDVRVDIVRSTQAAVTHVRAARYRMVVSDMGRKEGNGDVPNAGVHLTTEIRAMEPKIPIIIYCGRRAKQVLGDAALAAGATAVTDSPFELAEHFRNHGLL